MEPFRSPISGISEFTSRTHTGYIPVLQTQSFRSSTNWTVDRLLRTNGVIAIIIGSLIFLSVYAWVDAFAQLYREHILDPKPPIHHLRPVENINLPSKWRFIYAIVLTIATFIITYILLYVWYTFELT